MSGAGRSRGAPVRRHPGAVSAPHICHISTAFNRRSGSARRTLHIIQESVEVGYVVSVVVGDSHDAGGPSWSSRTPLYEVPTLQKAIHPWRDLRAFFHLWRLLRRLRPDLVHTHLAKAGILGRLAARLAGVPRVVHTVHGPSFPDRFGRFKRGTLLRLERLCARFTDRFVFVGEALLAEYVEAGVCAAEDSVVIHGGRKASALAPHRLQDAERRELRRQMSAGASDRFLLLAIGRIVPSKNFGETIALLAELWRAGLDAHLAIVGEALNSAETSYVDVVRRRVVEAGVEERVTFLGYRDDLPQLVQATDVVVMTSAYEGLPNVALEAAAIGVPFAGYEVNGLRELFSDEQLAWVVPQGERGRLADAVRSIAERPEASAAIASQRVDLLRRRYSLATMLERKMEFYGEVFADAGRPVASSERELGAGRA